MEKYGEGFYTYTRDHKLWNSENWVTRKAIITFHALRLIKENYIHLSIIVLSRTLQNDIIELKTSKHTSSPVTV